VTIVRSDCRLIWPRGVAEGERHHLQHGPQEKTAMKIAAGPAAGTARRFAGADRTAVVAPRPRQPDA